MWSNPIDTVGGSDERWNQGCSLSLMDLPHAHIGDENELVVSRNDT